MAGQNVFDVLHGQLLLRLDAPRKIHGIRSVIRVVPVPDDVVGIEEALDEPAARGVVDLVGIAVAAEGVAGVEFSVK